MRRWLALLLLMLLPVLSACSGQNSQAEAPTPPAEPTEAASTTLMVYMIGSDLEAKTAAGTQDLDEMAASGVDTSSINVLVYAGGSPYWHNEVVVEECNTILQLTDAGFAAVHSQPAVSMGEPETLTGFLEYCWENYPAEQYALILWNHGSGPVRGYGQDLVFNGGNLLLSEMEAALEASPFGMDNPLLFVGFDACLMASAELACVWDDYARYMVSSQEVEPSIGWNYQFVKDVGYPDPVTMLQLLTENYISSCEAYYKEKNYDYRETTLSCVDLSLAPELEQAIDRLFDHAADDVQLKYDQLSALRVQTRAFGRASTGSEYDLVDLGDLTERLSVLYPEEAAQLRDILDRMVLSNANNTQICSGLSLYYPFYNKDYFFRSIRGADSWQTTYQNLGLFPSYQQYLEEYQQIWNNTDRLDQFARCTMPSGEGGVYSLQLTEEQQSCYASARYYILRRKSAELYTGVFASSDVTNQDGLLIAHFDGNVIYARDKYGNYTLPVVVEEDRIGDLSHYSIPVGLGNQIPDSRHYLGGESRSAAYQYLLVLDKESEALSVSALLPYHADSEQLSGGKLEDADLSQWTSALFMDLRHRYLTRDKNGLILPLEKWQETSWLTGRLLNFADGIEFVYEPLEGGEYYLMIEVRDTQGSRYCSELLPITISDQQRPVYQYPETDVQWDTGDRVLLTEENGVAVYLNLVEDLGKIRFTLELENNNDFGANLIAGQLVCNQNIYCKEDYGSIHAEPGQSAWFGSLYNLGLAEECGALEELTDISFKLQVRDEKYGSMLIEPRVFHVHLSEQLTEAFRTGYDRTEYTKNPFLGALAEKQVIYSDDGMVVTLLGLGNKEGEFSPELFGVIQVENRTDDPLYVSFDGAAVNRQYIDTTMEETNIPARHTAYLKVSLYQDLFQQMQITQIEDIQLLLRVIEERSVITGFSDPRWCSVELSQKAANPEPFREAELVIFDKKGIRIAASSPQEVFGTTEWELTVYNGSPYSIKVDVVNVTVNGTPSPQEYISKAQVGPGQYGTGVFKCYLSLEEIQEITFNIQIMDIFEESVIFTDEEVITLNIPQEVSGS